MQRIDSDCVAHFCLLLANRKVKLRGKENLVEQTFSLFEEAMLEGNK
jgi:hypothetical protein